MRVVISGGTGFIGNALTEELISYGHEVFILTRSPEKQNDSEKVHHIQWVKDGAKPEKELVNIDAFINLAGESINSGRWTAKRKQRILESRIEATREMIRLVKIIQPHTFIHASAIGYYQPSKLITHTETSQDIANDFLAQTVKRWEEEASEAINLGVRTVYTRFGIILGKEDGALPRIAIPYKLFAGGTIGSGEQWASWIHLKDTVRAIRFTLETNDIQGPVNITAPSPVTMKELGQILAKVINRPHWFPTPSFVIKAVLGEMSTLVLEGQKVIPSVLMDHGFSFMYPSLEKALVNIYKNQD
ncbi:uncharacterized protein (TIGR01777 family) [Bacillus pakistanensis]|uniref:Uncharacterized protein (TIGR01777 family) n=1 Tax=Rossellomorea pakistanensis TaxID=992288 RepID=A0ABS2NGW0_9BACI|nr:TIGR01777 family oxidoreductase [Bacillus pakistanensis]MBM7587101.1 uncharacterized protein (TIGR01777 family) [Bacillus pakistanensis]